MNSVNSKSTDTVLSWARVPVTAHHVFMSPDCRFMYPDCRFGSVVDRHRVDADPDPHPNFHVYADPDLDPIGLALKRCRSSCGSCPKFYTFNHGTASYNVLSFSQCRYVIVLTILESWTIYWNFLEKSLVYQRFNFLGIGTDPDPAKWHGSDPIRIHNTAFRIRLVLRKT